VLEPIEARHLIFWRCVSRFILKLFPMFNLSTDFSIDGFELDDQQILFWDKSWDWERMVGYFRQPD